MSKRVRKKYSRGNKTRGRSKPLTRNAKVVILICTAVAVFLLGAVVWWGLAGNPAAESKNISQPETEEKQDRTEGEQESAVDDSTQSNLEDGEEKIDSGETEAEAGETSSVIGLDPNIREEMTLPYTVPGTDLIIDAVDSYSGVFIEDGSDEEVSNIFAIHVKNEGENVEYSSINLEVDGKELNFTISDLPSGAAVSVLENSRAAYSDGTPVYRGNQTAYIDKFDMMSSEVGIVIGDDNGMTVTNLTDEKIPCLRIFYKFAQDDEYLGGITYTAKIDGLDAGDSITIYPSHFSKEGSKVMMVRTYETTE